MQKQKPDPRREPVKAKKKRYDVPKVVEYGDISKLTAGTFSHGADGIGMTMVPCL